MYGSPVPLQLLAPLLGSLFATFPAPAGAAAASPPPASPVVYAGDARTVRFEPGLRSPAYVAIDADTGEVLIARRERARLPIASLTKVMTGLLVAESGHLERRATVPKDAPLVEPNRDDLVPGRRYRRDVLLYSTLMVSANDSALTLATDEGGGSAVRFYERMNRRARELGLSDTVYASANGLDDRHNLSTALDQALLARAALRNPTFARIVRTPYRLQPWARPTIAKDYVNHNRMLRTYPGTYGVKTGWTTRAGGCLVVAVRRNGHHVIGVVLRSKNVWADMPRLIDAAFRRVGG